MILSRAVKAPDGSAWTIERHWAPRPRWWRGLEECSRDRRRAREKEKEHDHRKGGWGWLDVLQIGDVEAPIGAVLLIIAVALVVFLIVWFGWPMFVFALDTLLFIPLVLLTILTRVVLRRPWMLEAATSASPRGPRSVIWKVVGWRRSSRAADRMAKAIAANGDVAGSPPEETPRAHRKTRR